MVERELAAFQLATLDELTGIANRRGFIGLAEYSLHLCGRQGIPAPLMFLDLDHFMPINDTFGHAEGDRALMIFAALMREAFRESDLVARLGGDEFAVFLPDTSRSGAEEVLGRLRNNVLHHNRKANCGYDIEFSCSIVEVHPRGPLPVAELLADGDRLMYQLKKSKSAEVTGRVGLAV